MAVNAAEACVTILKNRKCTESRRTAVRRQARTRSRNAGAARSSGIAAAPNEVRVTLAGLLKLAAEWPIDAADKPGWGRIALC